MGQAEPATRSFPGPNAEVSRAIGRTLDCILSSVQVVNHLKILRSAWGAEHTSLVAGYMF